MGRSQRNPLASKKLVFPAVLLLLSVGFLTGAHAQTSTVGTISGTVRDPNGAAVPKAEITISEERTGYSRKATTNEDGFYTAQSLPLGRYTVSTSPSGFKKTVNSGLELHVNESLVVNLTLTVGGATEVVNVTAESVQVETTKGDVSSLIAEKQVTELPLDGRNYAALVTIVPGISPALGGNFAVRGTGLDSHIDMSVNGNQSNGNLWTVDGVNNMDVGSNGTLLVFPSIDSIAEFRVERNSFSAEYGQAQGAVINLITKGGTNRFHGTAFEFLRSDSLNATDFFLNNGGQPKQKLKFNNFGFNFNGPIKKDKIFFFFSEEWRREQRGTVLQSHVPTAQERVGDFSGTLTAPRPIDPLTGSPFPGNKIPANRLSPAGLAIVKIFPDPTNPGLPLGANWTSSTTEPVSTRQDLFRVDWTINSKMNLMVRYINETWTHGNAAGNFWGDSAFPTLSSDWDQPSKSFAVKLSNTLGSTAVNEFQFSRAGNDIFVATNPNGTALNDEIASKFPTVFPRTAGTGLPTIGWGGQGYPLLWHQAPWQNHEDLWIWKDDISKVWGAHSLKFGGLASQNIKNEQPNGGSGLSVVQQDGGGGPTGNYIASLLLKDLPLTEYSEVDHQETTLGRWHDFEIYGNDTWKVRPNLTLTLGLRWSRFAAAYSDDNRVSNYIPSRFNGSDPLSGLVRADQAGQAGLSRSLVNPYNKGFQPRLGVAWDIFGDGKTALRLGAGRYIGRTQVIGDLLNMALNPPWSVTVDTGWQGGRKTLADCPTCRSLDTINSGLKNAVAGVSSDTSFFAVSQNFRPPESWQWNITISREVMKNTVVEASYVGNHGLHLWRSGVPYNDVVPGARFAIANAIRNNPDAVGGLTKANRIHQGLGPINGDESSGDSRYNSLQLWLNRRFSDRLSFQAAYTWAHAITNVPLTSFTASTSDPFNYDLDRGDADLDRRQTLVFNAVYVLPSLQKWGPVARYVLGDWQLNTIASFFGGTPIDVQSGVNTGGTAANRNPRPNLVPGVPIYLHGDPLHFLNKAAFALPAVGQFGNLGRGAIRGPGTKNVDFSVNKNWRFHERYGVQFRAELFNAFNHASFSANEVDAGLSFSNAGVVGNGNFGVIGSPYRGPREIQFGFKFTF